MLSEPSNFNSEHNCLVYITAYSGVMVCILQNTPFGSPMC